MKKILITGVNSYVGNNLESWLNQYPEQYQVDKISVRGDDWKEADLSQYDSIVHVAGIAHKKETKKNKKLYYKINRDLTIELAEKAKKENVSQFIFLSTMSVYGLEEGIISENTPLEPSTYYGKSKKEAEDYLCKLESTNFKVAIIRPPMIYGKNCPGNYQKLRKIALITPFFPDIKNARSMIFIENLSMFIEKIIIDKEKGLFLPQNKEYIETSNLVDEINLVAGKNIKQTKIFNFFIKSIKLNIFKKVFGNLVYTKGVSSSLEEFIKFEESVKLTEKAERSNEI